MQKKEKEDKKIKNLMYDISFYKGK